MNDRQLPQIPLSPLRFEPIYQYRLWGGRRLVDVLTAPLPGDGPIGEAWLLSDREEHPSLVADGPLKGRTIGELMKQWPEQLLGKLAGRFRRFPLLLKFLDARDTLSVQVHPSDRHTDYLPAGETGKTEAWVVLAAGPTSRIYAGLKPTTTADNLWRVIANGAVADHLAGFAPHPGDGIFVPAGTVHSLHDVVVIEVQENSDVTFRLTSFHGWDAGALWEDTKFAVNHFADIEKLAMVGEKRWQQGMATFCKPFTKATIRYFDHADAAEARKWLAEA